MDAKRKEAGQKLLEAAYEFWSACQQEGQHGAVQWLEDCSGQLLVFTRGEYRQTIMNNISSLPSEKVHYFNGEVIPGDDDED